MIKKVYKVEMILPFSSIYIEKTVTEIVSNILINKLETEYLIELLTKIKNGDIN
ncbi:hypothetical protein CLTEP_01120 [Clostridium tepidiprofundi DSM 19306]|uniref:Uncharacterized protein n=1 Tax=Clostridium tepidiprofundi DSM 19306 TaxID=1121338 RepID=A0A151B748_9CLOT|nr:hypothetical protein [Clostridium tepidiprofundi]KYH35719.1 hypothetical protein CLTEP_01120 [Clostridium tepidiprofundi DSM 19306]